MKIQSMTPEQIRALGLDALARALGPVGMVRFLQQFEAGTGDYVAERQAWLGQEGVEGLAAKIRAARQSP